MMNQGNQRVVVVTGASTGIGKAIALALDANGFRVFAGVRQEADGAALRREATGMLMPLFLDVTDASSIARAVETVTAQTDGALYGLVNNAGVGLGGPLELVPISETRKAAKLARMPVRLRDWLLTRFMYAGIEHKAREAGSIKQPLSV